jgi:hypothetical protein
MTSLRGRRRSLVIAVAVLGCVLLAVLAALSLRRVGQAVSKTAMSCSPSPCSAPEGFEVDISGLSVAGDTVMMQVAFKNRTVADPLEAVSYRHTSPADFQLRTATGQQVSPVFNGRCPNWPELKVQRGASAGPKPLCFRGAGFNGAQLIWSPDLGLLFDDVQIPLG